MLSFNLEGMISTIIATTDPNRIIDGLKDCSIKIANKKDVKNPNKEPDNVLLPICIFGYIFPAIAAKESPTDTSNNATTAIDISNKATVIVNPINK